jgi:hypothetical protein
VPGRALTLFATLCLVVRGDASAEESPARKTVPAIRVNAAPTIDGVLGDPTWQEAAWVEDLHNVVQDEYAEPSERSRVYVAYDDDALYLAARFWDSEPDGVVAKVLRKGDVSFGEDGFSITLDPFDEGRGGYIFDVNPNGMRSEAIYLDDERQNWEWEGIWDAAARRDGEGWTAEVEIPSRRFRSIRRKTPGASISRAGSAARTSSSAGSPTIASRRSRTPAGYSASRAWNKGEVST